MHDPGPDSDSDRDGDVHDGGPRCPCCDGAVLRIQRRSLDRLLSVLMPVHRYRCQTHACNWEGLLSPCRGEAARRNHGL